MNRRGFLQTIAAALVTVPFVRQEHQPPPPVLESNAAVAKKIFDEHPVPLKDRKVMTGIGIQPVYDERDWSPEYKDYMKKSAEAFGKYRDEILIKALRGY